MEVNYRFDAVPSRRVETLVFHSWFLMVDMYGSDRVEPSPLGQSTRVGRWAKEGINTASDLGGYKFEEGDAMG